MTMPKQDLTLEQANKHLADQLDLANSRMQAVNHAYQAKTNDALELHAQFLLVQKKNADLVSTQAENQKVIDALQKKVNELMTEMKDKPEDSNADANPV
jgi:uncharacterized coiled-coil protein SlyX